MKINISKTDHFLLHLKAIACLCWDTTYYFILARDGVPKTLAFGKSSKQRVVLIAYVFENFENTLAVLLSTHATSFFNVYTTSSQRYGRCKDVNENEKTLCAYRDILKKRKLKKNNFDEKYAIQIFARNK